MPNIFIAHASGKGQRGIYCSSDIVPGARYRNTPRYLIVMSAPLRERVLLDRTLSARLYFRMGAGRQSVISYEAGICTFIQSFLLAPIANMPMDYERGADTPLRPSGSSGRRKSCSSIIMGAAVMKSRCGLRPCGSGRGSRWDASGAAGTEGAYMIGDAGVDGGGVSMPFARQFQRIFQSQIDADAMCRF